MGIQRYMSKQINEMVNLQTNYQRIINTLQIKLHTQIKFRQNIRIK